MTSTNDGKDVKSNHTSGQKGKSFYIQLYTSLDGRLNEECDVPARTEHLCEAWRRIHSLCKHSVPDTQTHLLSWLQRHTARTILPTAWSQKYKDEQARLTEAIDAFIQEVAASAAARDGVRLPWEEQLQRRGEWFKRILDKPWDHPVLRVLLNSEGQKLSDDEILEWLKEERGVMFVMRLRELVASKGCVDLALSLISAVMDRVRATIEVTPDSEQIEEPKDKPEPPNEVPSFAEILKSEAGFTKDIWEQVTDIEFVLLYKNEQTTCIERAKQTPLSSGYLLIERLRTRLTVSPREKKLWKNAKDVAILIAQVLITRCMVVAACQGVVRHALYRCTLSLVRMMRPPDLPPAARSLAAPAASARHLHTLATAVHTETKTEMVPFVCELYVRAITAGMNELERLKLKTEKEAEARLAEQTLCLWFTQLGVLLAGSERVKCECMLTAFSVHPSAAMYERIRTAPILPRIALDNQDNKEETTSEFGSWATDSRSQTNLVKTSEHLNMKQTQQQANVLSTAILNEGEALGLSPELCQDLAVLLSGPRVKTLSWDMDREALLERCRVHVERTGGGTRALTTELRYLNLDPRAYQHLPEEADEENDLFYGIEKGTAGCITRALTTELRYLNLDPRAYQHLPEEADEENDLFYGIEKGTAGCITRALTTELRYLNLDPRAYQHLPEEADEENDLFYGIEKGTAGCITRALTTELRYLNLDPRAYQHLPEEADEENDLFYGIEKGTPGCITRALTTELRYLNLDPRAYQHLPEEADEENDLFYGIEKGTAGCITRALTTELRYLNLDPRAYQHLPEEADEENDLFYGIEKGTPGCITRALTTELRYLNLDPRAYQHLPEEADEENDLFYGIEKGTAGCITRALTTELRYLNLDPRAYQHLPEEADEENDLFYGIEKGTPGCITRALTTELRYLNLDPRAYQHLPEEADEENDLFYGIEKGTAGCITRALTTELRYLNLDPRAYQHLPEEADEENDLFYGIEKGTPGCITRALTTELRYLNLDPRAYQHLPEEADEENDLFYGIEKGTAGCITRALTTELRYLNLDPRAYQHLPEEADEENDLFYGIEKGTPGCITRALTTELRYLNLDPRAYQHLPEEADEENDLFYGIEKGTAGCITRALTTELRYLNLDPRAYQHLPEEADEENDLFYGIEKGTPGCITRALTTELRYLNLDPRAYQHLPEEADEENDLFYGIEKGTAGCITRALTTELRYLNLDPRAYQHLPEEADEENDLFYGIEKGTAGCITRALTTELRYLNLDPRAYQHLPEEADEENDLFYGIEKGTPGCITRALTTELRYLNLDPRAYQHLPEEADEENDLFYGIEKGYEHLVEFQDDHWEDGIFDPERTESAFSSSSESELVKVRRKKKSKKIALSSDDDGNPLSVYAESKREKKKERPHSKERSSKERSKERKKKSYDSAEGKERSRERRKEKSEKKEKKESEEDKQKKKEKKPRKKKSKEPLVDPLSDSKPGSLSSLIGMKVAKIKIPEGKYKRSEATNVAAPCITDSDYDSQGKSSLASLNSEGNDPDVLFDGLFSMDDYKSPERQDPLSNRSTLSQSELSVANGQVSVNTTPTPSKGHEKLNPDIKYYTYNTKDIPVSPLMSRPINDATPNQSKRKQSMSEEVRKGLSKLIELRRQQRNLSEDAEKSSTPPPAQKNNDRPPTIVHKSPSAIIRPEFPEQTVISPKAIEVPEIPKVFINKQQVEQIKNIKNEVDMFIKNTFSPKPVIQYANKQNVSNVLLQQMSYEDYVKYNSASNLPGHGCRPHSQHEEMRDIMKKAMKPNVLQKPKSSQSLENNGQRNFQDFLRELQHSLNPGTGTKRPVKPSPSQKTTAKKELMPCSRVTPVIPSKSVKTEPTSFQSAKPVTKGKKVDNQLNTFARLSYLHKNKHIVDALANHQEQILQRNIEEHKTAKLKHLQSKGEVVISRVSSAIQKPSENNSHVVLRKVDKPSSIIKDQHSIIASLLSQNPIATHSQATVNFDSNTNLLKTDKPKALNMTQTRCTSLSEKDQNDLLLLLRQQNKLNTQPSVVNNQASNFNMVVNNAQIPKTPLASTVSNTDSKSNRSVIMSHHKNEVHLSKMQNIEGCEIKNGHDSLQRLNTLSDCKISKPNKVTSRKSSTSSLEQLHIEASHAMKDSNMQCVDNEPQDWEKVMDAILAHKTPSRGPKALDVALKKDTFASKNLRNQRIVRPNSAIDSSKITDIGKYVQSPSIKSPFAPQTSKPQIANPILPVCTLPKNSGNVAISKVNVSQTLPPEVSIKMQKQIIKPETVKKPSVNIQPPIKMQTQIIKPQTVKKGAPEVQKKRYSTELPKEKDPFISGIPNSDYDLLEELMDDELRKEIGELSDDDTYQPTVVNSVKMTKVVKSSNNTTTSAPPQKIEAVDLRYPNVQKEQRVTVIQTNTPVNTPKSVTATGRESAPNFVSIENSKLNITEHKVIAEAESKAPIKSQVIKPQTSQVISNQNNERWPGNENTNQINVVDSRSVLITAISQPAVQNVVLIAPETRLVYDTYATIQAPLHTGLVAPSPYVAFNNAPNITVYQTTQFTTPVINPVIIGNVAVPVNTPNVPNDIPYMATDKSQNITSNQTETNITGSPSKDCSKLLPESIDVSNLDFAKVNISNAAIETSTTSNAQPNNQHIESVTKLKASCNLDINSNQNCEKKALPQVIEKKKIKPSEKALETRESSVYTDKNKECSKPKVTDIEYLKPKAGEIEIKNSEVSKNNEATLTVAKMNISKNIERLKQKRLALLNRQINHISANAVIPLDYTSLLRLKSPIGASTTDNTEDLCANNNFALNEPQYKKYLNNKEVDHHNNESSKENKINETGCRRILLRSSNNLNPKTVPDDIKTIEKVVSRKTKVRLKNKTDKKIEVDKIKKAENIEPNVDIPGGEIISQEKVDQEGVKASQRRVSKRTLKVKPKKTASTKSRTKVPKVHKVRKEQKIPNEQNSKKLKTSKSTKPNNNLCVDPQKVAGIDFIDIEAELQGSRIEKTVPITSEKEIVMSQMNAENENVEELLSKNHTTLKAPHEDLKTSDNSIKNIRENHKDSSIPKIEKANISVNKLKIDCNSKAVMNEVKTKRNSNNVTESDSASISHSPVAGDLQTKENLDKNIKKHVKIIPQESPFKTLGIIKTVDINDILKQNKEDNSVKGTQTAEKMTGEKHNKITKDVQIDEQPNKNICNKQQSGTPIQKHGQEIVGIPEIKPNVAEQKNDEKTIVNDGNNDVNDAIKNRNTFEYLKNKISIEELPSNDPENKFVRVKLPNGKVFKATVYGKMHVSVESLFADHRLRAILINRLNDSKRYTLNVKQISKATKKDPTKITETRIEDINLQVKDPEPIETVNLLSDDEDENEPQIFKTEFGEYKVSLLDVDEFKQHQLKFNQKCFVKIYETTSIPLSNELETHVSPIEIKEAQKNTSNEDHSKDKNEEIKPVIPESLSTPNKIPIVSVPEVIEIEDSSNDSLEVVDNMPSTSVEQVIPTETVTPLKSNDQSPDEKINVFKNLLLHELGVDLDKTSEEKRVKSHSNIIPMDCEIIDHTTTHKQNQYDSLTKKCVLKLTRCDDLYEKLKMLNRKCIIKLLRCDDENNKLCENTKSDNDFDNSNEIIDVGQEDDMSDACESIPALSRSGSFSLLNEFPYFDDSDIHFASPDRSYDNYRSSPVIEVFETIAAFKSSSMQSENAGDRHITMPLEHCKYRCFTDWFVTKKDIVFYEKQKCLTQVLPQMAVYETKNINALMNCVNETNINNDKVPMLKTLTAKIFQDYSVLDQFYQRNANNGSLSPSIKLKRKMESNGSKSTASKIVKITNEKSLKQTKNVQCGFERNEGIGATYQSIGNIEKYEFERDKINVLEKKSSLFSDITEIKSDRLVNCCFNVTKNPDSINTSQVHDIDETERAPGQNIIQSYEILNDKDLDFHMSNTANLKERCEEMNVDTGKDNNAYEDRLENPVMQASHVSEKTIASENDTSVKVLSFLAVASVDSVSKKNNHVIIDAASKSKLLSQNKMNTSCFEEQKLSDIILHTHANNLSDKCKEYSGEKNISTDIEQFNTDRVSFEDGFIQTSHKVEKPMEAETKNDIYTKDESSYEVITGQLNDTYVIASLSSDPTTAERLNKIKNSCLEEEQNQTEKKERKFDEHVKEIVNTRQESRDENSIDTGNTDTSEIDTENTVMHASNQVGKEVGKEGNSAGAVTFNLSEVNSLDVVKHTSYLVENKDGEENSINTGRPDTIEINTRDAAMHASDLVENTEEISIDTDRPDISEINSEASITRTFDAPQNEMNNAELFIAHIASQIQEVSRVDVARISEKAVESSHKIEDSLEQKQISKNNALHLTLKSDKPKQMSEDAVILSEKQIEATTVFQNECIEKTKDVVNAENVDSTYDYDLKVTYSSDGQTVVNVTDVVVEDSLQNESSSDKLVCKVTQDHLISAVKSDDGIVEITETKNNVCGAQETVVSDDSKANTKNFNDSFIDKVTDAKFEVTNKIVITENKDVQQIQGKVNHLHDSIRIDLENKSVAETDCATNKIFVGETNDPLAKSLLIKDTEIFCDGHVIEVKTDCKVDSIDNLFEQSSPTLLEGEHLQTFDSQNSKNLKIPDEDENDTYINEKDQSANHDSSDIITTKTILDHAYTLTNKYVELGNENDNNGKQTDEQIVQSAISSEDIPKESLEKMLDAFDESTENSAHKEVTLVYKDGTDVVLKGIEYEDPVVGTCYVFPLAADELSLSGDNEVDDSSEEVTGFVKDRDEKEIIIETPIEEPLEVNLPRVTYSKLSNDYRRKHLKRKMEASENKISGKRYRKGKNIDYPKITSAAMSDSAYGKEFKRVFDYSSSLKFSYSQPFHKDIIDTDDMVKDWPIKSACSDHNSMEVSDNDNVLFFETESVSYSQTNSNEITLVEEINTVNIESESSSHKVQESNFNMGFGEGSGRVIQNLEEVGDVSKFSAATLSDVKQPQPFLLSEDYEDCERNQEYHTNAKKDQLKVMKRYMTYIQLRDKVRSFFQKTTIELSYDWIKQQGKYKSDLGNFPFDFYAADFIEPCPIEPVVQVVQVGQLPVSAAAQNPVTCDPRVTQVSDISPSQCSAENSPDDDSQVTIKTEYTELTTADLTLPLQEYAQHNQSLPMGSQEPINITVPDDNIPIETEIKSVVKIEMEEIPQIKEEASDNLESGKGEDTLATTGDMNNLEYSFETNDGNIPAPLQEVSNYCVEYNNTPEKSNASESFVQNQQHSTQNGTTEKTDQIAHAMNAAGINTTTEPITNTTRAHALVNILSQKLRQGTVNATQSTTNNFSKSTSINAMALQQALAQILPPPLNQTNVNENNQQTQNTQVGPQVLHIVQGKNANGQSQITLVDNSQQSVINTNNATPVLHIVQNKSGATNTSTNAAGAQQTNSFGSLSLVDAGLQQGGNQLLHIVNTGSQKNNNTTGQLLKRVNLLTNLANVQGSNEQKMVQFVCKSADGKSIQLNAPHQRSMVLRLQPIETPNVQPPQKPVENQDVSPNQNTSGKDSASQQEIKSRSIYEENYAKFIQNASSKTGGPEKSTSLPKFNQAFGKPVFQDGTQKQNEINSNNTHLPSGNSNTENNECQSTENTLNIDHMGQISSPPLLLRKTTQTSQAQANLVQQIKQTIAPMNIQTMHGGVIYTRQIPVNIGGGQTINLITVPSTELIDDSQKQGGNQNEVEPSIIKIVPQNQSTSNTEMSGDDANSSVNGQNEPAQNPQPQPVLTQMRIKLPMLSKAPQMVSGARVVRPSFFQIQRNVIGGANQPVYQQLVLTAAPPLGQPTIRLPQTQTQTHANRPIKVPTENQSSAESQMSSSTLEQLREFDMVLEQVKERSTVQPSSSTGGSFSKIHTASTDSTDGTPAASSTTTETTQVLYSIGNSQPLNVAYVNRKTSVTTPTTSTFVRSPDSSGIVDSPTSATHVQIPHTVTSETVQNETQSQPKPSKSSSKSKSRPKASSNPPNTLKLNTVPPKTSTQKPLEDEQTTQRILYILAEYKEQVENSPDKDKPAPRRRSNPPTNPSGSSKRKKSSSGSRRHGMRDMSPVHGEDTCRTMGSEDSSCGTSQGDCNESCLESHSPQDSPRKVAKKLTFEQETPAPQPRPTIPQRNVIVADGQTITVARGTAGKPATAVLMPANYILPVSMVKGGQQIAIVTNRGPKLLTVGGGEGGATNALLLQRLIGPAGLKPVLARPGVRHVRLPTAALHNLQAFNLATATTVQPPDSTASPAPAPTPPELVDTRATSSPWAERDMQDVKPERASSPEGSEPWNLPSHGDPHDYSYEETVRTDNLDRTVLDPIPDRYSPDMEAQRIFDKMFDVESKKSYLGDSHDDSPRCAYDIDASDCDDKAYHQVVQKKDGLSHRQHRLTHVSAAALRHKYAILEHELRLQKSLSEECEDLGVDSPSASELFPEAELLFAASPAHEHTHDQPHHSHTPQPTIMNQSGIPQPDIDDQIATDQLLSRNDMAEDQQDLNLGLEDVGIVTVSEDGATIALDQEEFARSHPNTTFHSEPTDDGEVQPFTISGLKGRHITSTIFHSNRAPATVLMTAPQTTVISQATAESTGHNPVKYSDIDNMINSIPSGNTNNINLSSVLVKDDGLTRFDSILNDSRELHLSNTASAIVHSAGNATQVIRRVCYDDDKRFLMDEPDALIAGDDAKMIAEDSSRDATLESMPGDVDDDRSSPERHAELFWESNSASERSESRRPLDFSSDSEKCCKSPSYDETNSTDSSGVGAHMRLDSVIKEARGVERSGSADGSSADDTHPPLRTYPPKRMYHPLEGEMERSLSGKTRAGERSPESLEVRRRASGRGVVKRGCHCCNGSPAPPKPKKSRQKKPTMDFNTN